MSELFSAIENKILSLLSNKNAKEGLKLFRTRFSAETPASQDFVKHCFTELNKFQQHQDAYDLLIEVAPWYGKDSQVFELHLLAKRIYYDSLVVQANSLVEQTRELEKDYARQLADTEAIYREKIDKENRATISDRYRKTLTLLDIARGINPEGLGALTTIVKCFKSLGMIREADDTSDIIEKITKQRELAEIDYSEIFDEAEKEVEEDDSEAKHDAAKARSSRKESDKPASPDASFGRLNDMFANKRFQDLKIELSDFLVANPGYTPAIQLLAATLVELKRFNEAERLILNAIELNTCDEELTKTYAEFLEKKRKVLARVSVEHLTKGLQLGKSLGRKNFLKALELLQRAAEITPDDVSLLDHIHTCQIYLGELEKALETQKHILMIQPAFKTTFHRESVAALCFFADYAYQQDPIKLEVFREFRRNFLISSSPGQRLISFYSRLAPKTIKLLKSLRVPPVFVRFLLFPLLLLARLPGKIAQ